MLSAWGGDLCVRHLWKLSEKSYAEFIQSFFFVFLGKHESGNLEHLFTELTQTNLVIKHFNAFTFTVFPEKPSSVPERYHSPNARHRTQMTKNVYHKQPSLNRYTHTTLAPCRLEATEYSFCYSCKENSYNL